MKQLVVREARVWGKDLPGIATPRLIEAGRGQAYFKPSDSPGIDGVWYLHVPGEYESPDGTYTNVVVGWVEEEA